MSTGLTLIRERYTVHSISMGTDTDTKFRHADLQGQQTVSEELTSADLQFACSALRCLLVGCLHGSDRLVCSANKNASESS